ncbi:MAG: carboxy terminal-processing peptidase [Puniceicoccales bacterium]|jgi:carboxyl-terminal processing protease|nr:carboxy terminal-processing peptidase [Puniceicoccales bacterium]
MISIRRNLLFLGIAFTVNQGVCVAETRTNSGANATPPIFFPQEKVEERYREKREKTSQEITFEEPQFMPLEQTSAMRLETICMMRCLEDVHYLHKKLKSLDFKKILEEYVSLIDVSKMFFLQSEIDNFTKRFAPTLDAFLNGGSLTPGFSIFDVYRQKIRDRVQWIFKCMDQNQFELHSDEVFSFNREKEDFVKYREALEHLWTCRLNFEIINEIVLQESLERRREQSIIDASMKEESRTPALFFKEMSQQYFSPKVRCREPRLPLKTHRPIPRNLVELFAFHRSLCLARRIVSNVYRLYLDGGDIKLPLNFDEKVELAKKNIKQRYQSLLRNIAQLESWIVQEQFLNSIARVYDPHTSFMAHESMEELREMLHHSFVGIGAYLGDDNGRCIVRELIPGGPAAKSKEIQVGDCIVAIAQESGEYVDVSGMLLNKITKLLRGKRGTKVFVKLQPSGDISELKTVALNRDEIELTESRASAKLFQLKDGEKTWHVGIVNLPGFYGENEKEAGHSDSAADMTALIQKLKTENMEGLILDLRNNNGGILEQSVLIGGLFVEGPMVQVRGQYGNIERFDTKTNQILWDGPLIILVSKMSASAAEILAGALKDHNRAIIVGDKNTHGKGTVQVLLPMEQLFSRFKYKENLGASRVTIQKWYRPSGISTQIMGVEADIAYPSFDSLLPLGEVDLPHAIPWDKIDPLKMNPQHKISAEILAQLKDLSQKRQQNYPEFQLLNDRILRLKKVLDMKILAVDLEQRRNEKCEDEAIQRVLDQRMKLLAKDNEPFKEILLDAIVMRNAEKSEQKAKSSTTTPELEYIDTHLKESLRIMVDFLKI